MYISCIIIFYYLLFVQTNAHIYIKTLIYIINAPKCFGASAPSSESFDISYVIIIEYFNIQYQSSLKMVQKHRNM